jgi:hypothetical protein
MAKLKIQHTRVEPLGTVVVDSYANNQKLDSSGAANLSGNWEGGVGGFTSQTIPTILPKVKVRSISVGNGSIIKQKGAHKFQVSNETTVNDESIVAGSIYRINSVGTTDWTQFGAGPNATTNDVFVAKVAGSAIVAGSGTAQTVSTCTLVNLATPTAANTMSVLCTVASIADPATANIGTGTISGYTNRTSAYLTWTSGTGSLFEVGQTVNLVNTNLTGVFTVGAVNTSTNLTIVTSSAAQTISANTADSSTVTFMASKISSKYVWDFLNGGTLESSTTGGFTGANNPNRYRYWFSTESSTFVKMASA